VKFCEQKMHDLIAISLPIKKPSQIAGTLIEKMVILNRNHGMQDKKPFVVSISPCTARKWKQCGKSSTAPCS
jgi:iron only hydrogenase large subunit-like protein